MGFNRNSVYNTISEDLDKKAINKRDKVIEGIKGNLYDVLTLGDDVNTEACDKIIDNLEQKLEKAKNAEYPKESYIKNLEFLIKDAEKRKAEGVGLGVEDKNKPYMDLDLGGGFDQKVLNTVVDNIAELAKDSDQIDDILIKRLIGDEKYKEALKVKLMGKKDSLLLNETQKQNLQSIIDSFDSKNDTKEATPETENEEETIEGQLPPEENDIYGFISEDTGISMDDLKNNYKVDIISISDDNAEDDWPIAKYRLSKKSNEKEEQPKEEKLEKEGQLPPEVKDIYGFISEDTGIPIEDLKDESKYRVELVSISDDNAEDDCPIAGYKVYKELNKSEGEEKKEEEKKEEKKKEKKKTKKKAKKKIKKEEEKKEEEKKDEEKKDEEKKDEEKKDKEKKDEEKKDEEKKDEEKKDEEKKDEEKEDEEKKDEEKKEDEKKDEEKKDEEKKEDEKKEDEKPKEELVKEGQLPPEVKDIYGFISEETGIPIEDLKDEKKYRVELVSIGDDNAEDDCPIAGYKVYKKLDKSEPDEEKKEEEKKEEEKKEEKKEEEKKEEEKKEEKKEEEKKEEKLDPVIETKNLGEQRERVATITSVNQINRAIAQREADEELRERKANMKPRNVFDRANLFLRRQFIKDRLVDKKLGNKTGFDRSEAGQFAADRHQIEQQNKLAERIKVVIEDIDKDNYPVTRGKLDKLLDDLTGNPNTVPPRQRSIDDAHFQVEFKSIIEQSGKNYDKQKPSTATSTNWRPISELINSNDMGQLSTNILMQANKFRDHQFMVRDIAHYLMLDSLSDKTKVKQAYPNYNSNFDTWCRGRIQKYVNTYNDIPDFLHQMGVNLDSKEATKNIRTLQISDGVLDTISAQTLKLKIQMLNDGGEAYNVKKRGGLAKIGRWLDRPDYLNSKRWREHPNFKEFYGRFRGAVKIGVMAAPGLVAGALGAGPLCVAGVVGGMSALTTLFKKKSHYEKEQRSYQRMQATNLEDYRKKREELANEVAGMKRYEGRFWGEKARIRSQFRDYVNTTHDQLDLSTELTKKIEKRLQSVSPLDEAQKRYLVQDVADGLARLDYHKKTGENFLGSNNSAVAEQEYRALQNAVMGGARRLGAVDANGNPDMEIIRNTDPFNAYYNSTISIIENGQGDEYNTQGYLKARKRYRRRSNLKAADGALKAGAISFGLSYLASSLASSKAKYSDQDKLEQMSHGREGGEYHLGDAQEHLFASGDVNPTMNSVITNDTQGITGATIYSSVDSVPCSVAKGHAEYVLAETDLSSTFSSSPFATNPDWIAAKTNFINEARSSIWSMPGVSEGNRQLALARAMEGRNEGILKPAIASGNTSMTIDPSAIHRLDGGMQSTGTGMAGQAFRNMGVVNIDYIQKVGTESVLTQEAVSRAIPIPVGLNTFGEPKSEVKKTSGESESEDRLAA